MRQEYSRSNIFVSFKADEGVPHVSAQPSYLAEYVLFPIYDFLVIFIPSFITPNQVTLFGIFCTLTSSALLLSSMKAGVVFEPSTPTWVPTYAADVHQSPLGPLYPSVLKPVFSFFTPQTLLLFGGFLNLLYCIADNTDGRLARRDHRSSVVGEYLDHSLDCVTSLLSTGVVFCVLGASTSNMAFSISSIAIGTLLVHTYHFECNVFVWGNRWMTVDEAMLLFAFGLWVPVFIPNEIYIETPLPLSIVQYFSFLKGLRLLDLFYIVSLVSQVVTVVQLGWQKFSMLFRFQMLFITLVAFVLLHYVPAHSALILQNPPKEGDPWSWTNNFYFGPFSYPAVWTIAAAVSYSTIIHMPIVSRCAGKQHIDYLPLVGVIVTLLLFPSFPTKAMLWACFFHVVQILLNLRVLLVSHAEKMKTKKK